MKILKSLKLKIMISVEIDRIALLIGVLEIIKRECSNDDFSNKASLFLDKLFLCSLSGSIFFDLPKPLIKEISKFFDEYIHVYGDYGCIGGLACDDAMINMLTDYEGNIIFNPHEN